MEALIAILLDATSSDGEKDDAAIELGNFTTDRVEKVLFAVSNEPSYNEMIRASCGESLAEIWLQRSRVDFSKLDNLKGIAFVEALSLIQSRRTDWYEQYRRSHLKK
jgi:hypothetical protein